MEQKVVWLQHPQENEEQDEEHTPIHGDLLEVVLSFVPLVDLILARQVSESWNRATVSSLANLKRIKPWFIVHLQSIYSSELRSTHAYDPRSDVWIEIGQPLTKYTPALRSANGNFLYVLSTSAMSFSVDPLHLEWRQVKSPLFSRVDPIVALCGGRIVVAGGGWDFEDDPFAVEMYDFDSSTWRRCQSMPDILKDSAAATWLSVAANHDTMFVTEKSSGITHAFDPTTGTWRGPYDLRPDPRVTFSAVGFVGKNLILAGLISGAESLRLWRVDIKTMACEPIGSAPPAIMETLSPESGELRQIEVSPAENFLYMYNPSAPAEVVHCEISGAGECVWGCTRNAAFRGDLRVGERMVVSCGSVEMGDLETAMRSGNRRFSVVC